MTRAALLLACLTLSACGGFGASNAPTEFEPMGEFRLGHNIVVARNVQKVPISRDATVEELETAMKSALQERFGGYEGRKLYHIGVSVDAYALAPPGVPIVVSPKSVLVVTANIWDDARGVKLGEPRQFTVWENLTGETAIGSGLTQTAEQQLRNLSRNAAKMIQDWMLEHPEWFEIDEEAAARLDELEAAAAARASAEAAQHGTAVSPNPRPRLRTPVAVSAAEAAAARPPAVASPAVEAPAAVPVEAPA